MKRVLVTGAAGFVGRQTIDPLRRRGFDVHTVTRATPVPGTRWHAADLMDPAAQRRLLEAVRPTHLLHLAWETEPGFFWAAPVNLDWLAASLTLLRAFRETGGQRIVVAGSCAEYDWADPALAGDLPETAPRRPATLYGHAKDSLRRMLDAYARDTGLSHGWGMLFQAYGPHEKAGRVIASVVKALLEGRPAACSAGTQLRDFMDCRDIGPAFAALLDSEVQGAVNIASGEAVTVAEVVTRLGALTGRPDLVQLGARPMAAGEPPRLVADITRLRREVGYAPAIPLDRGLAESVAWWREELHLPLAGAGI